MTTPLYAAAFAVFYIYISIQVIKTRRAKLVSVGDGGDADLLRAMRCQANFAEYVPLSLLLIYFFEVQGGPLWTVHGLGFLLLVGRFFHFYGFRQSDEDFRFRVGGMVLTFTALGLAAAALVILKFYQSCDCWGS